jgi:hypothetical protein
VNIPVYDILIRATLKGDHLALVVESEAEIKRHLNLAPAGVQRTGDKLYGQFSVSLCVDIVPTAKAGPTLTLIHVNDNLESSWTTEAAILGVVQ